MQLFGNRVTQTHTYQRKLVHTQVMEVDAYSREGREVQLKLELLWRFDKRQGEFTEDEVIQRVPELVRAATRDVVADMGHHMCKRPDLVDQISAQAKTLLKGYGVRIEALTRCVVKKPEKE